ncbi:MAG: DEAD/DEAH box helicase [Verrucomicrobiota bacterium]
MSFSELGLAPGILQAVAETGYSEPTPIQAAAIPPILAGRDLTGIAQTGTGKTAAFTLPILTRMAGQPEVRGIQTLVLAPTRELAAQIIDNVRIYGKHLGFRSAAVFGGVGEKPQIDALRAGTPFVVACPGRLLDLMNRGFGDFSRLRYLVLDEADRMLDMGFLPDMRRILAKLPKDRQTLLFSATLSREIESLSRDFQRDPELVEIGKRTNPAETVTQEFCEVEKARKPALLVKLLEDPAMSMVLVFTRTKHGADRIAKLLERQGIRTGALHANRSQGQRLRALGDFRDGRLRVLVATDIAARGIDVEGISHVVNFDFPPQVEDYVHRIGRTGRAAAVGHAISFITGDDRDAVRALERRTGRVVPRMMPAGFDAGNAGAVEPPRQAQGRGGRPQGRPGNAGGRPQGRPGNSGGGVSRGSARPVQGQGRPQRSGPRPEQSSGERAAPRAEVSGEAREAERPTLRGRRLRKW